MVPTGIYYALALAVLATAAYFVHPLLSLPFDALILFCLWFFRDPERTIPEGPVAVSPADGKVVSIKDLGSGQTRISIFLNVFDVHVNRTPIAGEVKAIRYQKGKFGHAAHEEASTENEQNELVVEQDGVRVKFTQIAGLIARRIVCYKKVGDRVNKGERIGLIKFGSRVDVYLGPEWTLAVESGQRVSAGSSVLATRKA
jgi:phosphatidylserine decarboxylase